MLLLVLAALTQVPINGYISPTNQPTKLVVYIDGHGYLYTGGFTPSITNPNVLMFSGVAEVIQAPAPSDIAKNLRVYTNQARAKKRLSELQDDPRLDLAAQRWADECARTNLFSHFNPTKTSTPWIRIAAVGITSTLASENMAMGQRTFNEVVDDWMKSSGHRANLLGNWTHMGSGSAVRKDGKVVWVTDYAAE